MFIFPYPCESCLLTRDLWLFECMWQSLVGFTDIQRSAYVQCAGPVFRLYCDEGNVFVYITQQNDMIAAVF